METGRNGATCLECEPKERKRDSRAGTACKVRYERVRARRKASRFVSASHPYTGSWRDESTFESASPGWSRKAVLADETRTSEVGIAVSIKAPPAREARGVGSQPGLRTSRAHPPKLAPANSYANDSVWIQAARTALGLERPPPSPWCTTPSVPATNGEDGFVRSFSSANAPDELPRIGA